MTLFYTPPEGCTIYDLVLNGYTSLNLMSKFIRDNNIEHIDIITTAGQTFQYESDLIYDFFIFDEIVNNDYKFCTGKGLSQDATNYLLIENTDILSTEGDNLFLT